MAVRNPYIVNLASQEGKLHKRHSSYSNIRIHPLVTGPLISSASAYLVGPNTPLSKAIETLQSVLLVHPVQGNLKIPPRCSEYSSGLNKGKCRSPLPSQSTFKCGGSSNIPLSYIGTREVCASSYGSCTTEGPDGPGLPNADYLLFVSTFSRKFFINSRLHSIHVYIFVNVIAVLFLLQVYCNNDNLCTYMTR